MDENTDRGRSGNGSEVGTVTPLRLQSDVVGEGPPLGLIGGGLTGWHSWIPHAERLAASRSVARFQLLSVGYGLENRPLPEGYSVRTESTALAAALDEIGWSEQPIDLAAWSYGAVVTLDFALAYPDRVRTLTLIEPPAFWVLAALIERPAVSDLAAPIERPASSVLPDGRGADPELDALLALARDLQAADDVDATHLERFVRTVALVPPGEEPEALPQWPLWLEHRRSLRSTTAPFDHRDDLSRLDGFPRPTLLVTGTGTSGFLRRIHNELAARLPGARTVEMPGGHAPHLVSMDRFMEEFGRHLDGGGGR